MSDHHGHHGDHHHHHHEPRISTPEERALLEPFVDDLHQFLRGALAGIAGPIAEIGAGDGVIADRLRTDGFTIVAIDADEATAAAASEQGRPVLHADWLKWDGGGHAPFDALLFTRSLHHIEPLDEAVAQMARLAPGGRVVADEFGFELVDRAGAQLLVDSWALLAAAGLRDDEPAVEADPLDSWQRRMTVDHEVTPSEALIAAPGEVASIEQVVPGPMIAQMAMFKVDPAHARAAALRDLLVATEQARIESGIITAAGRRIVATIRS